LQVATIAFSNYVRRLVLNALAGLGEDVGPGHESWTHHLRTAQALAQFFSADVLKLVLERQARAKADEPPPGGGQ
jgi:hypothetical protein